jgi:phosphoribosylanthranilate isomerase
VKICCIKSVEEAKLAISHGASAIGLVSAMPSGPGVIPESLIANIAASVPPPVATFLLSSEIHPQKIIAQQRRCGTNTLQLVDHLPCSAHDQIREALPGIKLVQMVHVTNEESVKYAVSVSDHVDALLLDSGNLTGSVKEFGGTGRTHDWNLSRQIRDGVPIPVFLAGGLNSANVAKAIEAVEPFGIDLCSSVRTNHLLDIEKLETFFKAIPNQ